GLREGAFDLAGHGGVEAGEDELRRAAGRRGVDAERRDLVGQRRRQPPCRRVAIRLPRRSLARAEPRRPEPGMGREARDELLADVLAGWISHVMRDTDAFFAPPPTADYALTASRDGGVLTFPSALATPHESNNTVYARFFPAKAVPSVPDTSNRSAVANDSPR